MWNISRCQPQLPCGGFLLGLFRPVLALPHYSSKTIPTLIFANSDYTNYTPTANIYAMPLRKGIRHVAKRFLGKPEQQSRSSSDPSLSASMAGPREPDPHATAATSSGCPPTSEQQPALPLRVHAAPPAGDTGSQDCLRPMSTSEIRERTYAALTRRLTSGELRGVKWERSVGSTAKIIEDLKTTLRGGRHSKTTSNILEHINKYCGIGDITSKLHSDISALVWTGARPLIQVSPTLNSVTFRK